MRSFSLFIGRLLIAAGVVHAGFSASLGLLLDRLLPSRMPNVRCYEPNDKKGMNDFIAGYFDAVRRDGRPLVGLFGSSFCWGYPYPQDATLSGPMVEALPDRRIVNAGVLSYGLDGIYEVTRIARHQKCRFEAVFVEIPIVNELSNLAPYGEREAWRTHYAETDAYTSSVRGMTYFRWFLERPAGVRYPALILEELSLSREHGPLQLVQPAAGYFTDRQTFEKIRAVYERKVAATLEGVQEISDRVFAFPSPVLLSANDRVKYDTGALREQIEATYLACGKVPGVVALRPAEQFLVDDELYSNLTHFNVRGNRAFGDWLTGEIRSGGAAGHETVGAVTGAVRR